jgi:hypothetical protein
MFIRNEKVAKESNAMLAYTYGDGKEPADGGTKDTWNKSKYLDKTHIPIKALGKPIQTQLEFAAPEKKIQLCNYYCIYKRRERHYIEKLY